MKTISLSVSEGDYEAFRLAALAQGRPIAQMIREAMAWYRVEHLPERDALRDAPILVGHRAVAPLPSRDEFYEEVFAARTARDEDAT